MQVNGVQNDKESALFGPICFQRGFQRDEKGKVKTDPETNEPIKNLLVFWAQPLWNYDDFEERCPKPVPEGTAVKFTPDKGKIIDWQDPNYLEQLRAYGQKKWGYLVLKSLEPSNVIFDNARLDDPDTWSNVGEELDRELAYYEKAAVLKLVDEANALDKAKLEENLQSFFRQAGLKPGGESGPLSETNEASST